ncbi:MAG TPA: hypothetical protein VKG45_10075 [Actinomycetes bacterium]|nr:hypothetical protein [Actinomycetes bacterium]
MLDRTLLSGHDKAVLKSGNADEILRAIQAKGGAIPPIIVVVTER